MSIERSTPTDRPSGVEPAAFDARVQSIAWEADGVLALTLTAVGGQPLPAWEPGAHIDVELAPGLVRQYSLCGTPGDRSRWRIAILLEPESRGGSEWVHTRLRPGDIVGVKGPRNNFRLVSADNYIFIAGGIGITPLLPMIDQVAQGGAEWELLYGGRHSASMAFVDELVPHGANVVVSPQDETGLLDLEKLLDQPRVGTAIYCCGPEPLIVAVEEHSAAWPSGSLHVERFRPRPGALDGVNTTFEVVLERSGLTVLVGADQTIVEALEAVGVDVPTSCREGTCGTCETEVIDGEVDHRDSFLSEEERDGGTMMICCSRARSERLVLDL